MMLNRHALFINFYLKIILVFFSVAVPIFSGEVISSSVSHEEDVYTASIEMQIDAPTDIVYALFLDFDNLAQLSARITHSEIIDEDPPEYTVLVETHNCILFFCMDLQQTQQVLELGEGYILVEDIKDESDFIFANSRWHIRAHGKGTRVSFSSEIKPDFWLPPIIGPWLFETSLIKETQNMIEQLEKLASHDPQAQ